MARVSLILGGARSGKSARALSLAMDAPKIFVATAEALDDEMAERIALHKSERGPEWGLVEEPIAIARAIDAQKAGTLVIDCLTLWLSNLMHHGHDEEAAATSLREALGRTRARVILVSNEVGLSIAPENALARRFRDAQGRLNQRIAAAADHVELMAAGLPMVLKGTP